MPRWMIEILWTASLPGSAAATNACPISWCATISRSRGLRSRFFFSSPATIRSIARLKSFMPTWPAPRRVATSAASFTRFARSAPVKPGVSAATSSSFTSTARITLRVWTFRIWSRPMRSGRSTSTCRSKRPARRRAGSRISGRLVAARRTIPEVGSNPSSSTRSWFSVCSFSSWPPSPGMAPRARPRASSSSMKMMQGALARACSNRSRTRAAPTPTNISTNSEPPVLLRVPEEGNHFLQLGLGLVHSRHVGERHLGVGLDVHLRLGLADGHEPAARSAQLPRHAAADEDPDAEEDGDGYRPGQEQRDDVRVELPAVLDPVLVELLRDVRVHADRDEPLLPADRFLELARELVLPHDDIRDLVVADQLLELAIGDGRDRLPPDPEVLQGQHAHHGDEHVGEIEAGLLRVHVTPSRTMSTGSSLRSRRVAPPRSGRGG